MENFFPNQQYTSKGEPELGAKLLFRCLQFPVLVYGFIFPAHIGRFLAFSADPN
jgi:hypothetical protein